MKEITLSCEIITPMFMAGADGKTPELRPSEFKGMMRFWWRAVKAMDDVNKLKKEEAEIFGGTGEGEGKSRVKIVIEEKGIQVGTNLKSDYNLNWTYNRDKKSLFGEDAGLGYLLYSTTLPEKEKAFIKESSAFKLKLLSVDPTAFNQALASLWLAIYLGGFGTRARRGGGNIVVKNISDNNPIGINFIPHGKSKEQIKNWFVENLKKIKEIIPSGTTNKYTNLSKCKILIFDAKNDWKEALNFLGEKFKNFRADDNNKRRFFEMGVFGMPVMHNRFTMRLVPYDNNGKRISDRFSSPLIFKVIKSEGLFFPMIVRLNSTIEYVGKEIKQEKEQKQQKKQREQEEKQKWKLVDSNSIKPVSDTIIEDFINEVSNQAEVISYDELRNAIRTNP